MMVLMFLRVRMAVPVMMGMGMLMFLMVMIMFVIILHMNVKFDAGDSRFLVTGNVKVISVQAQFLQFMIELMRVNSEVQERSDEHIAADAAENIEIESFHSPNALICDAA